MNAIAIRTDNARALSQTAAAPARREHRVREFGIGYGSSSGYVRQRRYASNWIAPRFRLS